MRTGWAGGKFSCRVLQFEVSLKMPHRTEWVYEFGVYEEDQATGKILVHHQHI